MGRKSIRKERRQQILDAFYLLAKEEGINGADIRSIAKKAGIKPSIIYHYFIDKSELIEQLAPFAAEKHSLAITDITKEILNKEQLIEALANYMFNYDILSDDAGLYYDLWGAAKRNEKMAKSFRDAYRKARETIVALLKRMDPPPERTEKDLQDFAVVILGMFLGIYIQTDFDRERSDMKGSKKQFIAIMNSFYKLD